MVEIVNNNGQTSVESQITVDPSLIVVLKDPINRNRIKNMLKDLNLAHRLEEKEDVCTSIAARTTPNRFDAVKECDAVRQAHIEFLGQLEKIRDEQAVSIATQQSVDKTDITDEEKADYALLCALHDMIQEFGMIIVAIPKEILKLAYATDQNSKPTTSTTSQKETCGRSR